MKSWFKFNKCWKIFILLLVAAVFFSYGVLVGIFKLPPYSFLQKINESLNIDIGKLFIKTELMEVAFTKTLPDDIPLLYSATTNRKELKGHIDQIKTVPSSEFFEVYTNLNIGQSNYSADDILELTYKIEKKDFKTYAYYISNTTEENLNCAVLVIPGSGENQALAIYDEEGYHGAIRSTLSEYCDIFILIKPNHGYRSIHDGKNRLDADNFVYGHLLNEGYSYSATYIVESFAWINFIKENYEISGVAGLSQGGGASFIVALEGEPDFAIVSSGFSLYNREITWAGFNQIIIPGLYEYYSLDALQSLISKQKTKYLFTYGGEKDNFVYAKETETQESYLFLKEANPLTVFCFFHNQGHVFPEEDITVWLEEEIL